MRLDYVATDQMLADLLTKALGRIKFENFKKLLGIGKTGGGDTEAGEVLCAGES